MCYIFFISVKFRINVCVFIYASFSHPPPHREPVVIHLPAYHCFQGSRILVGRPRLTQNDATFRTCSKYEWSLCIILSCYQNGHVYRWERDMARGLSRIHPFQELAENASCFYVSRRQWNLPPPQEITSYFCTAGPVRGK